jgi:hypothetical protein
MSTTLTTLNSDQWFQIERKINEKTMKLLNTLITYAKQGAILKCDAKQRSFMEQRVLNTLYDTVIRPTLVSSLCLTSQPLVESKTKYSKINQMRLKTTYEQLSDALHNLPRHTPFFEINLIPLFEQARHLMMVRKSVDQDTIGLSVAIQNAITIVDNYEGICAIDPKIMKTVSPLFKQDLKDLYLSFNDKFPFNGLLLLEKSPELLIEPTKYFKIKNVSTMYPYEHQFQMIEYAKTMLRTRSAFFAFYSAPIGTGKTTSCIGVVNALSNPMKMLFICTNPSVRTDVANQAYNTGTYFCIVTMKNKGIKFTYQNRGARPSTSANTKLYICDPQVGKLILENANDYYFTTYGLTAKNLIVFFDEPTISANHSSTELNNTVFCHSWLPYGIIYSTATPPSVDKMNELLSDRKALLQHHSVDIITSDLVLIQSSVHLSNGTMINPWNNCLTVEDVENTIQTIHTNPFIARFVTAQGALQLYQQLMMIVPDPTSIPNMPQIFTEFDNLKPNKIREVVIQMLNVLIQYPDQIGHVCHVPLDLDDDKMNFSQGSCSDMTLVGSASPFNDAIRVFSDLPVKTCMEQVNEYCKAVASYNAAREKIDLQAERSEKKVDVELLKTRLEYPVLTLPKYNSFNPMQNCGTSALLETSAPDVLKVLLLYGIVVHDPLMEKSDSIYMDAIIDMIASGNVRYVFSSSFAYGVNYPFTKINIMKEYIESNTMNTILQLTGRAGRVNQSTKSNIVIPSSFAVTLLDSIKHPDRHNIEAHNIQTTYTSLQQRYNIQHLIDSLIVEEAVSVLTPVVELVAPAAEPVETPYVQEIVQESWED